MSQQREELLQLVTTERGTCHKQKKMELLRIGANLSYYKVFHRIFIASRNEKKKEIFMTKPVFLGLLILELSKILMYEFWYDYVKPKYGENTKLCYMNTDSFIVYIKRSTTSEDLQHLKV